MGLNIANSKTIVYKNDYGYSVPISSKNIDGEYENMYISANFPRDTQIENKTKILITKGFLSWYKTKDGLPKIKAVIQEFTTDADAQYEKEEREAIQNENNYNFDGSLPF